MPKIDQLVSATYGHPRMSFLDAFQGYHQIALATEDQEKTAFISPNANYHYIVMPFGLKNAGATYQRMMTRMFRDKIRRTFEVYIDDMVVKSKWDIKHIDDLKEVFEVFQRHKLHLNDNKCAFGVGAGKFLGYLITNRGIEVNPDQIEAIKHLKPPSNPKEVQILTGMLAAFNRFISKFANWCRPFYQLLKKWKGFQWNEECEKTFQGLKEYLMRAPMLTAPEPGKDLYMYLSISEHASLLKRSDFTGRLAKWGTRLGSFDIRYRPKNLVKGQVLADFVAEFSPRGGIKIICPVEVIPWKVFVDGASSALGAKAGIVVITSKGIKWEHSFRLGFKASNNEAENEALLVGLRVASDLGAKEVEVYLDSRLVVNQVQGSFEAKDPWMMEYLQLVKQTMDRFLSVRVTQVARGQNRHANSLATLTSSSTENIPRLIKVELVVKPSINAGVGVSLVTTAEPCWMDLIIDFLAEDLVQANEKEVEKVRWATAQYWLSADRKLYRRSFEGPYLQCLHLSKIEELLTELH
ncbi:uncharacterized protein LOC126703779 [Quercus robur]|uniref:uncharacterized protein LOC126703779 n=1 Tax=Quercus robur TaxID=38942 RepID=UPI002163F222|nr:uncharacterized protein LOC126703779 [Quercus robur]